MAKSLLDEVGIDVAHIIVSAGVVYSAKKSTNYNFTSGDSYIYTPDEMKRIVNEDRDALMEDGVDDVEDYFDDYMTVTNHEGTKKYTIDEYIALTTELSVENAYLNQTIF